MLQQPPPVVLLDAWVCRPLLCPHTEMGAASLCLWDAKVFCLLRAFAPVVTVSRMLFAWAMWSVGNFWGRDTTASFPERGSEIVNGNSFSLLRSQLTTTDSGESSKPSQSLVILSPISLFWSICKNHLPHSEILQNSCCLFICLLTIFFPLEWKPQEGRYLVSYMLCIPSP